MGLLRVLLLTLIARPLARVFTGVDVHGRENLPRHGPAIVVANHNSHVDTLLLLTMFPARTLGRVRPAAAADSFLANPVIGWFSRNIIGIVPVERKRVGRDVDVLAPARAALAAGDIVVIFPEGTRGDASDQLQPLKSGVARLAEACPTAPVTPVWIAGAGRVLPKGGGVPVPMVCSAHIGPPIAWRGDRHAFMDEIREALEALHAQAPPLRWSGE
ncbi:MAG: lysophospholipid acyltransferase family protein [Phenylobacterium sp.]